ncbi:MFS transporter [Prescottella sp. R16]|uniref:MFS transporter n=1 Tax=Prescottella sp. R16 TaxID=3064529 RepID=UPI00272E51E1|nr:MFS transporter [Prescottella sp. R16]
MPLRPIPTATPSVPLLTGVLCFVILVVSTQQTVVLPLTSIIGRQLDADATAVGWTLTAGFLSAAVATPVAGRTADLRRKRSVLLAVLSIVLAGSLLAALTESLPLLVVARVLQGVSFAAFPVCLAILRAELPAARLTSAMGLLSGTLGFGGAVGMVLIGLVVPPDADYRRAFWLATGLTVVAIAGVVVAVPARANPVRGRVDWTGAVLLGAGLVLILLPLSEGGGWGWFSPATLGSAAAGVVVLAGWFVFERRVDQPLVPSSMLTHRPVVCTHAAGVFIGAGMFVNITAVTYFVQTDRAAAGYGFDATPMHTGLLYILPGASVGVVVSMCSGVLIHRFGARAVMSGAGVLGVVGFCTLMFVHDTTWQVIAASMVTSAFTNLGYAVMPALLVAEVGPDLTGVANSVNSIARTVGSSVASALLATMLAASVASRASGTSPTAGGPAPAGVWVYTAAFGFGAVCAVVATVCVFVGTARRHGPEIDGRPQSASRASMSRADSAVLGSHSTS